MDLPLPDKNTILTVIGVNPLRKVKRSFYEQKLSVVVPDTNKKRRKIPRNFEQKEDDEPLVFEVVAETHLAVEVRNLREAKARGF